MPEKISMNTVVYEQQRDGLVSKVAQPPTRNLTGGFPVFPTSDLRNLASSKPSRGGGNRDLGPQGSGQTDTCYSLGADALLSVNFNKEALRFCG